MNYATAIDVGKRKRDQGRINEDSVAVNVLEDGTLAPNTVDANTTVESGMWNAGVNASASPEREVTNRTIQLEREQQQLERKATQLQEKRDQLPKVAYTAQASALRERIRSETGVDVGVRVVTEQISRA